MAKAGSMPRKPNIEWPQTAAESKKIGRPLEYTPEIGLAICEAMRAGDTVRDIDANPNLPSFVTVCNWLHRSRAGDPAFGEGEGAFFKQYALAKEDQSHWLGAEAFDKTRKCQTRDEAIAAKTHLAGAEWYTKVLNPKEFGDTKTQDVNVNITMHSALEAIEERRMKDITPPAKSLEHKETED